MFYMRTALINIKRYKSKSILNLLICIVLVVLLNLFIGSLESNRKQLANVSEAISIHSQISNLNGTQQTGLVIREPIVDAILQSKYITNPAISVVLTAGQGEFPKENLRAHMTIDAAGINNIEAISGISEQDVTLASGTSMNFLQSNTPTCLVEEGFLSENNWKIGQTITLSIYYDYMDQDYRYMMQQLATEEFYIAGSIMSMDGDYIPQVIVPFQWAREAFRENDIPFVANAASFNIKHPQQINEFKKEMKEELHLLEINPASDSSYAGNALVVNDETFILSASKIQNNIGILTGFLPFILLIIVFIGYITSFLLIQNRRGQYATMRSLGVSGRMCFVTFFMESMMIEVVGGTIGVFVSFLLTEQNRGILIITFAFFLLCYIFGTAGALGQLDRISVMKSLSQKD
ncbi:MAG: transporter permease [Herbinix sp.]|nr:transporter permease [Herbinix sp.]